MAVVEPTRDGVQIVLRQHSAANGNYHQPFESKGDLSGLVVIVSQNAVDLKSVYHALRQIFFFQGIFKEGEVGYGRSCGVHHWNMNGQQWIDMFMPRMIEITGLPFESWEARSRTSNLRARATPTRREPRLWHTSADHQQPLRAQREAADSKPLVHPVDGLRAPSASAHAESPIHHAMSLSVTSPRLSQALMEEYRLAHWRAAASSSTPPRQYAHAAAAVTPPPPAHVATAATLPPYPFTPPPAPAAPATSPTPPPHPFTPPRATAAPATLPSHTFTPPHGHPAAAAAATAAAAAPNGMPPPSA